MDWVTIDFEASCLPRHGRSFPIEVGICGPLGTCSWLIRPLPEWREWDWTEEAFGLHGITRQQLDREGLPPAEVLAEVQRAIGPARVVSDSMLDRVWWHTLVGAAVPVMAQAAPAAIQPRPTGAAAMDIRHIGTVFDEIGATPEQIRFAEQRAEALCPERHRAGPDARWLFTLLSTLAQRIEDDHEATARDPFPSWTTHHAYLSSIGAKRKGSV